MWIAFFALAQWMRPIVINKKQVCKRTLAFYNDANNTIYVNVYINNDGVPHSKR